jgi:hypothetical protein
MKGELCGAAAMRVLEMRARMAVLANIVIEVTGSLLDTVYKVVIRVEGV